MATKLGRVAVWWRALLPNGVRVQVQFAESKSEKTAIDQNTDLVGEVMPGLGVDRKHLHSRLARTAGSMRAKLQELQSLQREDALRAVRSIPTGHWTVHRGRRVYFGFIGNRAFMAREKTSVKLAEPHIVMHDEAPLHELLRALSEAGLRRIVLPEEVHDVDSLLKVKKHDSGITPIIQEDMGLETLLRVMSR